MNITDIIRKKKHNEELTKEEIRYAVNGFTNGEVKDYQMSAFLMAIYFNSMTDKEISEMTMAMVDSGDKIDLSSIEGIKVDKHSTGGVGDKVSIIVLPIVASLGVPVAKISGKGLGHTGGTIDKLESIPGFSTSLTLEKFLDNVKKHGIALAGQTENLTPADKKIYALRDVTETVDSIPLIASSIMSKKIASGADAIVLDVKTGEGAFMKTLDDSRALAKEMVSIGKNLGRETVAVITDMNQPLGYEIGNANEIIESIEVLKGKTIKGLSDVARQIASYMIYLGKKADTLEKATELVNETIHIGNALKKFEEFIEAQGGNPSITSDYSILPTPTKHYELKSDKTGYISGIKALSIGLSAMKLGAGRKTKEDELDYSAGISLKKQMGDFVKEGDVLLVLNHNLENIDESIKLAKEAFIFEDSNENIDSSFIKDIIS